MASDEEEEELAQLRAQRSQRTGVADLVSTSQSCQAHTYTRKVCSVTERLCVVIHKSIGTLQRGLQQKQKQADTAAGSWFQEPDSR